MADRQAIWSEPAAALASFLGAQSELIGQLYPGAYGRDFLANAANLPALTWRLISASFSPELDQDRPGYEIQLIQFTVYSTDEAELKRICGALSDLADAQLLGSLTMAYWKCLEFGPRSPWVFGETQFVDAEDQRIHRATSDWAFRMVRRQDVETNESDLTGGASLPSPTVSID